MGSVFCTIPKVNENKVYEVVEEFTEVNEIRDTSSSWELYECDVDDD